MLYEGSKKERLSIDKILGITPKKFESRGNNLQNYNLIEVKVTEKTILTTDFYGKFIEKLPHDTELVLSYKVEPNIDPPNDTEYVMSGIALVPKKDRVF